MHWKIKGKEESVDGCSICGKRLTRDSKNIIFNSSLVHAACLTCFVCNEIIEGIPVLREGKLYCAKHFDDDNNNQMRNSTDDRTSPNFSTGTNNGINSIKFQVNSPAPYQLSNYNVYPTPILQTKEPLRKQITIHAHLIDDSTNSIVTSGFQSGDVKVMREGVKSLKFNGLKWNKIGPIKTELNERINSMLKNTFRITYTVGDVTIATTEPFYIVTNSNQVPKELRDEVRPMKVENSQRTKKRQYDSEGDYEEEQRSSPKRTIITRSKAHTDGAAGQKEALCQRANYLQDRELTADKKLLRELLEKAIESGNVERAVEYAERVTVLQRQLLSLSSNYSS